MVTLPIGKEGITVLEADSTTCVSGILENGVDCLNLAGPHTMCVHERVRDVLSAIKHPT